MTLSIPDKWRWFTESRYGLFLHWGPYAAHGRGEQVLFREHLDPREYEAEYREALTALARSGRVLEINSRLPLDPVLVRWWHEVGGDAVSFGSDAHTPDGVGRGFVEATAVAEAAGFRRGADRFDLWRR